MTKANFGNPFRPVAFSPAWLRSPGVALVRQISDTRHFGPMPILADALEDAGCGHPDVLAHSPGEGQKVPRCRAVASVLGKV